MRLFFHFANLFDGYHEGRLTFQKRYDDICVEWLGGLKRPPVPIDDRTRAARSAPSPVGRSAGFLGSYAINKAAGDRRQFRDHVSARSRFFGDYDRFYRRREPGSVRFDFQAKTRQVAEPIKLVYLFIEKRTGQPPKAIPYVSSHEVETARQILEQVGSEEAPEFLDYALKEAAETKFRRPEPWRLQAVPAGLSRCQGTPRRYRGRRGSTARRARREAERRVYDQLRSCCRRSPICIVAERRSRRPSTSLAQEARPGFGHDGPLAEAIVAIERARITIERHADQIPSFADWQPKRRRLAVTRRAVLSTRAVVLIVGVLTQRTGGFYPREWGF